MVQLLCSQVVRSKLERELAMRGIEIDADSDWVLVERGYDPPPAVKSIVFDAIDFIDVARLVVGGLQVTPGRSSALTGQSGNTFTVIAPHEVRYLETEGDGIIACTPTGRYRVKETLQHYERAWAGIGFLRINKSQLANIVHVQEIVPWFNSRYVLRLTNGEELEVSKTYAKSLRNALKM